MRGVRAWAASVVLAAVCFAGAVGAQNPSDGGSTATPAEDRSMGFRPGVGDAQEQVPGGRLVIGAYAAVLLLIGGYVAFIARRAVRVERELHRLEDDLARGAHRPKTPADEDATP